MRPDLTARPVPDSEMAERDRLATPVQITCTVADVERQYRDAKALDFIVEASSDERTITTRYHDSDHYRVSGPLFRAILKAVQSAGREL